MALLSCEKTTKAATPSVVSHTCFLYRKGLVTRVVLGSRWASRQALKHVPLSVVYADIFISHGPAIREEGRLLKMIVCTSNVSINSQRGPEHWATAIWLGLFTIRRLNQNNRSISDMRAPSRYGGWGRLLCSIDGRWRGLGFPGFVAVRYATQTVVACGGTRTTIPPTGAILAAPDRVVVAKNIVGLACVGHIIRRGPAKRWHPDAQSCQRGRSPICGRGSDERVSRGLGGRRQRRRGCCVCAGQTPRGKSFGRRAQSARGWLTSIMPGSVSIGARARDMALLVRRRSGSAVVE